MLPASSSSVLNFPPRLNKKKGKDNQLSSNLRYEESYVRLWQQSIWQFQ